VCGKNDGTKRLAFVALTPFPLHNPLYHHQPPPHRPRQIPKREVGFGRFASGDDQKYQPAFTPPSWS
jgi:hypothetical protein